MLKIQLCITGINYILKYTEIVVIIIFHNITFFTVIFLSNKCFDNKRLLYIKNCKILVIFSLILKFTGLEQECQILLLYTLQSSAPALIKHNCTS